MTPRQNATCLFLFGLGANIYYQVIGYLAFTEIALVIIVPASVIFGNFVWKDSKMRVCLALIVLWLGSALLSDYIQESSLPDTLRGASRPIFLGATMYIAYRLLRPNPGAAMWFYLGLMISNTISMFIFKPGSIDATEQLYGTTISGDFAKQGITIIMSALPFVLFWKGERFPVLMGLITAALGLFSVFFGSRSAGGILFVAGILILIFSRVQLAGSRRFQVPKRSITILLLMGIVSALGALELYKEAAANGWLGEAANKKYMEQSQGRFGLILGGRLDVLSGILAVTSSPLIGHGSCAMDTYGYMLHAAEIASVDLDREYRAWLAAGFVRIPSHSQILEPWVEHGFFATFFWWYLIWIFTRCSFQGVFVRPKLFQAVVLLLLTRWWDMLFSPFGGRVAAGVAFTLFLVLVELGEEEDAKAQSKTTLSSRRMTHANIPFKRRPSLRTSQ